MLLESLPEGAMIHLKKEALVDCLVQKQLGLNHPCAEFISEVDFFAHEPWQLPALSKLGTKNDTWYYFYHRTMYKNSKVRKRKTNEGRWHETGDRKEVTDVASRRILVFMEGSHNKGQNTGWTLHEFEIGDRDNLVVGRLKKKSAVKHVKRKKANGKGESNDKLVKRKQNSSNRDLGDGPGSTSDNKFIESEYDPACLTKNPFKRTRIFDGHDINDNQSSISELPEVPAEEEANEDLPAQFAFVPWSEQSMERYSSVSSSNSDNLTFPTREMQSQFYKNSKNIASKEEGNCEFPNQPTCPPCQTQSTMRYSFTHFPSSSGSTVDHMELQTCYALENLTQQDIGPQEVNQEPPTQVSSPLWPMQTGEKHAMATFSTSDGSTIYFNDKENCANTMEETALEVCSQGKTYQISPHQPPFGNLPSEQGTSLADNHSMPQDPVHSTIENGIAEVSAGYINPFSPIFSPPPANPLSFSSSFSHDEWSVSTHPQYEGQQKLWNPSHFDKNEFFHSAFTSKLPKDTPMSLPLGNELDGYSYLWVDDSPTHAIGGLTSNST